MGVLYQDIHATLQMASPSTRAARALITRPQATFPDWDHLASIAMHSATPTCAVTIEATTAASGWGWPEELLATNQLRWVSSGMNLRPFHIAFPVDDLDAARHFYGTVLGCPEGRSAEHWIDFNLFGHQIVTHYKPGAAPRNRADFDSNPVDGHDVPIPHFGVVLTQEQWKQLAEQVRAAGVHFIIEPYTRFEGQVGEQSTMFFLDPAGNALEFKAFADLGQLFAK